ncbi:hypothetical protein [Streptomyces sp. NPDC089915]|uniref:hypothetical protein n=1 Tax=Streptomyces sp. NPDC089915 TaxID=3155186 RepID=UPI00342F1448
MEFFGPWVIRLDNATEPFWSKFTLAGTDDADGDYFPESGQVLEVSVTGGAWTISAHAASLDGEGGRGWVPRELRRGTRFDRMTGLIVDLEAGWPPGDVIGPLYFYMHFACVCGDPGVNPDPGPSPYDFTLPDRT